MQTRIEVGILGATGMVGQHFIKFLQGHPWFDDRLIPFLLEQAKNSVLAVGVLSKTVAIGVVPSPSSE